MGKTIALKKKEKKKDQKWIDKMLNKGREKKDDWSRKDQKWIGKLNKQCGKKQWFVCMECNKLKTGEWYFLITTLTIECEDCIKRNHPQFT